jgi:hypothetical protein
MNGNELKKALTDIVGETTDDPYNEWWSEYTGTNNFFHLLSGQTGYDATLKEMDKVTVKDKGVLEVEGLGTFKKIEVFEDNFDSYEGTCETFMIFEFDGNTYRVMSHLDSHSGGVWDSNIEHVEAVEKTIRVWENKNDY